MKALAKLCMLNDTCVGPGQKYKKCSTFCSKRQKITFSLITLFGPTVPSQISADLDVGRRPTDNCAEICEGTVGRSLPMREKGAAASPGKLQPLPPALSCTPTLLLLPPCCCCLLPPPCCCCPPTARRRFETLRKGVSKRCPFILVSAASPLPSQLQPLLRRCHQKPLLTCADASHVVWCTGAVV